MEIAMYYTIQRLEAHIKNLEKKQFMDAALTNNAAIANSELVKKKEIELKHKLHIKQNLRNVVKVADDRRFQDFDQYFSVLSK